ncbi:MAG: hypothetical protein HRF51_00255 [bacterium]|jgi:hypothetical protein
MSFGIDIACAVQIDGQQEVVDAHVSQEYGDSSSVIEVTFDWNHFTAGFPNIVAPVGGRLPSIISPVNFIATNKTGSVNNGVSNPTGITANAAALNISYSGHPCRSQPVDLHFYLANFPEFTRISPLQVNLNGLLIDFQYASDGRINRKAIISGIALDRLTETIELLNDCCWLCSLAAGCLVVMPRIDVFVNGGISQTYLKNVDLSMPDTGKSLVHDRMNAITLKSFLENSVGHFRIVCSDYNLSALIHLGLLAKHNHYLQVKALLMSDFLEVLRYQFAANVGVRTGILSQRNTEFYWIRNSIRATFEAILQRFCGDTGLSGWDSDFKDLRNEIMHTGDLTGSNKFGRYGNLHHFCDRVLLALLNWDRYGGHYIPFDNQVSTSFSHNSSDVSVNRIPYTR